LIGFEGRQAFTKMAAGIFENLIYLSLGLFDLRRLAKSE
jgi:hypothetical protein